MFAQMSLSAGIYSLLLFYISAKQKKCNPAQEDFLIPSLDCIIILISFISSLLMFSIGPKIHR